VPLDVRHGRLFYRYSLQPRLRAIRLIIDKKAGELIIKDIWIDGGGSLTYSRHLYSRKEVNDEKDSLIITLNYIRCLNQFPP